MKDVSQTKEQISASVDREIIKAINAIKDAEKRTFSQMVNLLLAEAVESRKRST